MRALTAAMESSDPPQTLPNRLPRVLGSKRIAARERSDAFQRSLPKPTLLPAIIIPCYALLQPLLGRKIQYCGKRDPASTCFTLQTGLGFRRDPPAIDFGLHALQCSAFPQSLHIRPDHWILFRNRKERSESTANGLLGWRESGKPYRQHSGMNRRRSTICLSM